MRSFIFFTWCKKKPVKVIDTLLLTKCILCEISVDNKKGYVAVVYRSPSKITMNWIFFKKILKLCHIKLSLLVSDFNVTSRAWCAGDKKETVENQWDSSKKFYGYQQLITADITSNTYLFSFSFFHRLDHLWST